MEPILELKNVSKHFGGVTAAEHVDLRVFPEQIHGLIGPNGAGKSTLMNIISGIYEADEGQIFLGGEDITAIPAHRRAKMGIGRTFQTPRFLQRASIRDNLLAGSDVADNFSFLQSYLGKQQANFDEYVQELLDIAHLSFDWDDDVTALPFGKQKILEIVRAMLMRPRVMLVDEPAAGLNQKEIIDVIDLLRFAAKEKQIGVLLIEHSMDMVMDICENILVINFGKEIVTGPPAVVANHPEVIEAYLGRDIHD